MQNQDNIPAKKTETRLPVPGKSQKLLDQRVALRADAVAEKTRLEKRAAKIEYTVGKMVLSDNAVWDHVIPLLRPKIDAMGRNGELIHQYWLLLDEIDSLKKILN